MSRHKIALLSVACMVMGGLQAQSPELTDWEKAAGGKMAFDVASVKATKFPAPPSLTFPLDSGNAKPPGGRFSASFPLSAYIRFAYKLDPNPEQDRTLAQLPGSLNNDLYEIEAKAEGNPTKDQVRLMMQSLLADRFKLKTHFETREVALFHLVLVMPDTMGPKLHPHAEGRPCPESYAPPAPFALPKDGDVFPPVCEYMMAWARSGMWLVGGRNITMQYLASSVASTGHMAGELDKPVVDQTGLTGKFDFTVEYARGENDLLFRSLPPIPNGAPREPPRDNQGPTFVEALRQQLGLKLESSKGPVQILVIDHVEKPSEN